MKVKGTRFEEASAVDFGSTPTSFKVTSPTSIVATAPPGTGLVEVMVVTPGGTSASTTVDQFTYVPAGPKPRIGRLSPKQGPAAGGTKVTITGTGFIGVTGVRFGQTEANYVVNSPTSITVTSPPHVSGVAEVSVTTPNGPSAEQPRCRLRL